MSDLNKIISTIINVSNDIVVKELSTSDINELSRLVLWDKTPDEKPMTFGGNYFRQSTKEKGLVIDTSSLMFDYELKTMMIAALHLGTVKGGTPYKWKTVVSRVRTLKSFCSFLQTKGYKSFRELNKSPELKLRNLITDFLNAPKSKGGMEQGKHTSAAKTVREGLTFLYTYGLVNSSLLAPLVDELTISKITKHEEQHRLKHSIIPTGVMKSVIESSTDYINNVKSNIGLFIEPHTKANKRIEGNNCSNPGSIIAASCRNFDNELGLGYNLVRDLNLHVYTLVLAFTGMRDNEVYALKNNSHSQRVETGETVFTIKSQLSKTTEGTIELDWVANEIVFEAVDLLSKVNEIYRERARLMLEHHMHKMPKGHLDRYEKGLKDNRLFGIQHTKNTARFVQASRASDANSGISMSKHSFQVTAIDIEQLEKMNCNYQSVSQLSGKRGLKYKVGDLFNLTSHQFRHTFAWFIIANRLGDLDDIKYQFKHLNSVMTFVYSERGYESLSELRTCIEYFEELTNKQAIEDIVESAKQKQVAGGGGDRLSKFLAKLNVNQSQVIYTTAQQPHFNSTQELIDFATRHSDSVRGLPHGYCTKGAGCKIKNASDPSHCLYCDTYYATPKHLPYWKAIKYSCEQKIARINTLPDTSRYQSFLTGLEDNLNAANEIINNLTSTTPINEQTTVES
ncbi:integrase [Shewanella pealeana]|uniref:Integrase family protein n=1 Tax=Shewanella pealeana (strain ATCC 700345 / ANG-SQ1) TaxID=398579 RepID=A8H3T2_SHEPA|nr:integrase [Shewanella pealeana]ABV87219.1 integrase family protein [Shewanella pealeana ATCC 700345]ABV88776.1 integrase family protein [Shewanella pealeana ATCC 700345]